MVDPEKQPATEHDVNLLIMQILQLEAESRTLRDILNDVIKEYPTAAVNSETFTEVFQDRSRKYHQKVMLWYEDQNPGFAAYLDALREPPAPPPGEPT
jgi:hypothetical protein